MAKAKKASTEKTKPKYPYATTPNDLRKILQLIPKKPKPSALTGPLIKTWGVPNNNASTSIGVLREVGLLESTGTPTEYYGRYMSTESGAILAALVKKRYELLFEQHESPQNASNEELTRFFNINSGGSESTIELQTRTFKVLSEFCRFDASIQQPLEGQSLSGSSLKGTSQNSATSSKIHFDIHIHLPESKSTAEYEAILRALSEHVFQKAKT